MDNEITYVFISKAPVALPEAVTEGDWDGVLDRIADLEAGLDLGELNDVDTSGVADGNTLIYDSGDPTHPWKPGTVTGGLPEMSDAGVDNIINTAPVTRIWANAALAATEVSPGIMDLSVVFGGTGVATGAARSDHTHSAVQTTLATGAATGNISSGTRNLRNTTGPTLANGIEYDVYGIAFVRARNNVNNGTVNLLMRIGSEGSYPQRSRSVQNVGGVPVDQIIQFRAVITGTGSGVTEFFAVQYSTGDATDLRDHEFYAEYKPRR